MDNPRAQNILSVFGPGDYNQLDIAARCVAGQGVIVFPTETVYGLGCLTSSAAAVRRIAAIKNRPAEQPLTVHVGTMAQFFDFDPVLSTQAEKIVRAFMPGPVTVLVHSIRAGRTLGFRFPDHEVCLNLIQRVGAPIFGTSANLSGGPSPFTLAQASEAMGGKVDLLIDSGETLYKQDSTILDLTGVAYRIVRRGAVPEEMIADCAN